MTRGFALDIGEAHLWVSLRETPCGQGLRPRHPYKNQRKIGPTAFAACCRSLRTPSKKPTAVGGWRKERIGRIALRAFCPSLHTPFGRLPAHAWQRW
jgi:hypothetical protein